jgi:hypothetical protein
MDVEDDKSLHSSEATVLGRDEEEGKGQMSQTEENRFDAGQVTSEVSSGPQEGQNRAQGVIVTRQVLVQTQSY